MARLTDFHRQQWTRKGSKDFSRDGWIREYCSRLLLVSFDWRKEQRKDSMRGSARAAELIALAVGLLRVEEEPCGGKDRQLLLVVAL
jgi:hypothetical protein